MLEKTEGRRRRLVFLFWLCISSLETHFHILKLKTLCLSLRQSKAKQVFFTSLPRTIHYIDKQKILNSSGAGIFDYAVEQLRSWVTTIEPVPKSPGATTEPVSHNYCGLCALEHVLCSKRSNHEEKPGHRNYRAASTRLSEWKAHIATKTQHSQK